MSLKAASSLMSYTGPGGCSHSRELVDDGQGNMVAAPGDWILTCGPCEASLTGHELWGPANEPAPLTADEIRLRDAQHQDATRNLWAGLANMPDQLAMLAMQNQTTMAILAKMLGVDVSNGLPALPAGTLPAGLVQGQAPAAPAPAAPPAPVQDAAPTSAPELTRQQKAAQTRAAKKAAAAGDAS